MLSLFAELNAPWAAVKRQRQGQTQGKERKKDQGGSKSSAWKNPQRSVYRRYLVCGHYRFKIDLIRPRGCDLINTLNDRLKTVNNPPP
jgi:hypothetical protein